MSKTESHLIRWGQAKQELMRKFEVWIAECPHTRKSDPKDMIEFLYQEGFIRGKDWKKFKNEVAERNKGSLFYKNYEPMREGFITPDSWV